MTRALVIVVVLGGLGLARVAAAYPQFQLSHDQTCAACHISPAGGELLNENGLNAADAISQFGTDPSFMYGKVPTPDWLVLGGDARLASGYIRTPQDYLATFPMQLDVYANAKYEHFRLDVTVGYQPGWYHLPNQVEERPPWSREHYLMWVENPDTNQGWFVRVGRFMPVFGLRFVEHVDYTRRFGGTQLYAETYGAAVEYVGEQVEGHLTGFVADPLIDTVEHSSGGAGYGELRLDPHTAVGAEGMIAKSHVEGGADLKFRGGVTGKRWIGEADLLLQAELIFTNQRIDQGISATESSGTNQLVGYLMGSWFAAPAWMIDVGIGHYSEDLRFSGTARDCADVNVHWFATSHVEGILMTRVEKFLFGPGSPTGGYVLLQAHYRL